MQAFEKLVEKNQWEKLIMQGGVTGDPEALLETLLTARQEEFIDWENKTVSFESEEFEALLTLCKEYAENQKQDTSDWVYEEFEAQTLAYIYRLYVENSDLWKRLPCTWISDGIGRNVYRVRLSELLCHLCRERQERGGMGVFKTAVRRHLPETHYRF